jgi:hypothetical protein
MMRNGPETESRASMHPEYAGNIMRGYPGKTRQKKLSGGGQQRQHNGRACVASTNNGPAKDPTEVHRPLSAHLRQLEPPPSRSTVVSLSRRHLTRGYTGHDAGTGPLQISQGNRRAAFRGVTECATGELRHAKSR